MNERTIPLPVSEAAFRRLDAHAKALGRTLQVHVATVLNEGFGLPACDVIGNMIEDAENESRDQRAFG
jgi:hypothetical protein